MKEIAAFVFDAYGTLYDVHSVVQACEARWPGRGAALSRLWRSKQLEYTWLRSLMARYVDFETVTREALRFACASLALDLAAPDEDMLLEGYRRLSPFPDAVAALEALAPMPLAILSNGSPAMLRPLVQASGFDRVIPLVLSVDDARIYKPAPRVYQLAVDALALPASQIGFVSANCWDACGAKAFGFRVFWVNRTQAPTDNLGFAPDNVLKDLRELARGVAL